MSEVDPIVGRTRDALGDRLTDVVEQPDAVTFVVAREDLLDLVTFLKDDSELRFARLVDMCGVDYLNLDRTPRFAVVYHLHSYALKRYVRVRVPVDEDDLSVPSLTGVWPGANWFERETYDLFGIEFANHPNLTRILLPDDWEGFPLRKDYPFTPEPVEYSFNPEQWQKAVQRGD